MTSHDRRAFGLDQPLPLDVQALENEIERLIGIRDLLDGDPDLEPSLGFVAHAYAHEPDLEGDCETYLSQFCPHGQHEDDEDSDPGGGDIQDEPHDEEPDKEPSLGWHNPMGGNGGPGWSMSDDAGDGWGGLDFRGDGDKTARAQLLDKQPKRKEFAEARGMLGNLFLDVGLPEPRSNVLPYMRTRDNDRFGGEL